ncbi:hypothetical protein CHS0354_027749 [Potamilus streckersoni]|uniref:Uncharacterized protein n=1 Tax=Potamilus streckersoni TaxID=2493646 RepID=A0AAE0T3L5_9BIVA|nr:hypothetical protein CHS0354_027749 [Potamilus streckersoni]
MWHHTNLLFLILCFFTENICCDDHEDDIYDITDKHSDFGPDIDTSHKRPWIPDMDANNEGPPTSNMDENDISPPIPSSLGRGNRPENDDENPQGHRNGIILIVFVSVAGVAVLLIVMACGLYILKKRHSAIENRNYHDNGTTEKQQLPFPTIFPENCPAYTSKMEEGEMKSVCMEFLRFGTSWYAPTIVSKPPPYTKVVDKTFDTNSTAAPGY